MENGVRFASVWRGLLGVERAVVEEVEFDAEAGVLVADAPRVDCPQHGPTVAAVPWARHGAGHTYAFDDQVAWLAVHTSRTAVAALMRVAWRTVGAICARVARDGQQAGDRLAGLRRIGIDELSYKRGHRYITCVVDHDTARLVWAWPGRDKATLNRLFDLLGAEGCAQITHVSADGADWIAQVVAARCPAAVRGMDPFHVVAWASDALDQVRRDVWNTTRGGKGRATEASKALKNARWALWRNPEDLTEAQQAKLDWIARTHPRLHRAWALKEGLRWVFTLARAGFRRLAIRALDRWLCWARRCRIPAFVDLAARVTTHRQAIEVGIDHLNNPQPERGLRPRAPGPPSKSRWSSRPATTGRTPNLTRRQGASLATLDRLRRPPATGRDPASGPTPPDREDHQIHNGPNKDTAVDQANPPTD